MPITQSARKKLRQDKKRSLRNKSIKLSYKSALKKARAQTTKDSLRQAQSKIDKAVKKGIIHANKGSRLKSRLSKIHPQARKTKIKNPSHVSQKAPRAK